MQDTIRYDYVIRLLRQFFQEKKGFLEVPTQSRVSILAACEDPRTITTYSLGGVTYPLPQTGQMWLEWEILENEDIDGVFCIGTSYRDEPNPIPGRHYRVYPQIDFEARGDMNSLRAMEQELLTFLGFGYGKSVPYEEVCSRYGVQFVEAEQETRLDKELGHTIFLESFPVRTHPFWNMKRAANGLYNKIDVLLYGMETIGSSERESDPVRMRESFFTISDGKYAKLLFDKFGKERVMKELDEYLALPMTPRFGAGIGITRLIRAMDLAGLFEPILPHVTRYRPTYFTTA